MSNVHCEKFPECMAMGVDSTMPTCGLEDCPGTKQREFAVKFAEAFATKPEPQTEDEETLAEMRAQLWAAGLDLEESAFIARMLFRNGQRITKAALTS